MTTDIYTGFLGEIPARSYSDSATRACEPQPSDHGQVLRRHSMPDTTHTCTDLWETPGTGQVEAPALVLGPSREEIAAV